MHQFAQSLRQRGATCVESSGLLRGLRKTARDYAPRDLGILDRGVSETSGKVSGRRSSLRRLR
jgi:hypothetical protein